MISEKKDLFDGSSSSSNTGNSQSPECANVSHLHFACLSHKADSRMSASLIVPLELEYMNKLQCRGWNSAAVITSVSSSMFTGLISTMSGPASVCIHRSSGIPTEALVGDAKVPQVDSQIIRRNICLAIRVDGDGVDVICMRIGVDLSGSRRNDVILLL